MNKNILIIASVVALVAVAGFVFANNNGGTEEIEKTNQVVEGDTMVFTGNGYSPNNLQVSVGTTVKFVNESDVHMWPASNLHPTHGIYSEFDPREPVAPGETWEFTFKRAGEWDMHDHLAPYMVGKIIVVDN